MGEQGNINKAHRDKLSALQTLKKHTVEKSKNVHSMWFCIHVAWCLEDSFDNVLWKNCVQNISAFGKDCQLELYRKTKCDGFQIQPSFFTGNFGLD